MTASLTMRVVSRNWPADRTSIAAILRWRGELPRSNPPISKGPRHWAPREVEVGNWELTSYDRTDDWTADYRADDDVPAHVQAEGRGELSVPESADVPEVPRQAGADARRERAREVRGVRSLLGGVPGGRHLPRSRRKRRQRDGGPPVREGLPDSQDPLHLLRLLRRGLSGLGDLH